MLLKDLVRFVLTEFRNAVELRIIAVVLAAHSVLPVVMS